MMKKAGLFIPENYQESLLEKFHEIEEIDLVDIYRYDEINRVDKISDYMINNVECIFVIDPSYTMQEIILSAIKNRKHLYLLNWELYEESFLKNIISLSREAEVLLYLNKNERTFFYKSFLSLYMSKPDLVNVFVEKDNSLAPNISLFTELLSIYKAIGKKLKHGNSNVIEEDEKVLIYNSVWTFEDQQLFDITFNFKNFNGVEIRLNRSGYTIKFHEDIEIYTSETKKVVTKNDFSDSFKNYFKTQVIKFLKDQDQLIIPDGDLYETLSFIETLKKINLKRLTS